MKNTPNKPNRWQLGWGVIALVLSLGQLQRWQLTTTSAVYLHDFLILGWLVIWLMTTKNIWSSWAKRCLAKVGRPELLFVGLLLTSWLVSFAQGISLVKPLLYVSRLVVYGLFAVSVVEQKALPSFEQNRWLGLLILAVVMAGLGWLQYFLVPDLRFLAALGWDDHYYRLVGTLLDPSFMALWLVMGWWYSRLALQAGSQRVAVGLLLLLTLAFTYSRSGYLAWFVSVGVALTISRYRDHWREFFLQAVILTVSIWWLPQPGGEGTKLSRTTSIVARQSITQQVVTQLQPHQWVIGKGWFVPTVATPAPRLSVAQDQVPDHGLQADNILVALLSYGGLLGTVSLGWLLFKYRQILALAELTPIWIAILTHSLFNNSLFQPFIWLYLCWGVAAAQLSKKSATTV